MSLDTITLTTNTPQQTPHTLTLEVVTCLYHGQRCGHQTNSMAYSRWGWNGVIRVRIIRVATVRGVDFMVQVTPLKMVGSFWKRFRLLTS